MRFSKKLISNKLLSMGFEQSTSNYIAEAVMFCHKKKIHPIDVNLNQDILPFLANKIGVTKGSIEQELIKSLREYWKSENNNTVKEVFNYNKKPTIKKLIMLILLNKSKLKEE